MEEVNGVFKMPAIRIPSEEELQDLSEELKLFCTLEEIKAIHGEFRSISHVLTRVNELRSETLPVRYPRTPGYKPRKEDNPYNAWFWRADIQGASVGKLKGKSVGIKDNIAVAGVPMMNGSHLLKGFVPDVDATVVSRILEAGGHILGKTTCENLCFSASSWTSATGAVINPHDVTRLSGGSSSGSAVAVQIGDVDIAVGSDTAGSIRVPASWSGIVGLKPTSGLVPYTGAMTFESTTDALGPMARTVKDAALLLEVMAGYDHGRDPMQKIEMNLPLYSTKLEDGVQGKKVALLKEGFELCVEDDVKNTVRQAALSLEKAKVSVSDISIPEHKDGFGLWMIIGLQGFYNSLTYGYGDIIGQRGYYHVTLQEMVRRNMESFSGNNSITQKLSFLVGEYLNRHYGKQFYGRAQNVGLMLARAYDKILEQYDAIIMPTTSHKASKLITEDTPISERIHQTFGMAVNTAAFNISGHPSLSINAGFSQGLPVGMMIVGRRYDDLTVLQIARAFEKIRDSK